MMEKLFDMASDLAQVAVENERYHHSAASRALIEQLLPSPSISWVNSPRMTGSRQKARNFGRSVSNAEFASISSSFSSKTVPDITINEDISEKIDEDTQVAFGEDAPGMAQSSVSDSCSDGEEGSDGNDACSQWAAELIANVESRQNLQISPTRPDRASSVGSEDCSVLSSSPRGFWTVPPGSAEGKTDDDGSIQWSPRSVSRASPTFTDDPAPFMLDDCCVTPTVQRVSFAPMATPISFLPPSSVDVSNIENQQTTAKLEPMVEPPPPVLTTGMTLKRSKSYTAMPSSSHARRSSETTPSHRGPDKSTERYIQYKKYFHNFIDLVIVRETTAALHHSKHASL